MAIKILALESHWINPTHPGATSGVDFARIINPMTHLAKHKDFEIEIRKNPFTKEDFNWQRITQRWDFIYTSYVDSDWGYVSMAVHSQRNGCQIVLDLDDNLWNIDPYSNVYKHYAENNGEKLFKVESILHDCKNLTTTNLTLKYKIKEKAQKNFNSIKIFPNYIDLNVYNYRTITAKPHDTVNIYWFGSGTHFSDLTRSTFTEGVDKLLKTYHNTRLVTVGMFVPELKTKWGKQYSFVLGDPDFYGWASKLWPKIMGEGDIFVSPLVDNVFTRCKSNIKWLETSAGKKPMVLQDIRQYRECVKQGETGFLAKTKDDWFVYLEKLLDPKLRKTMGEKAYEEVKKNHTIDGHVEDYANYFKEIYAGK